MPKYKSKALLGIFAKCYRPEICALLGSYTACSGKSSPTFGITYRSYLQVSRIQKALLRFWRWIG